LALACGPPDGRTGGTMCASHSSQRKLHEHTSGQTARAMTRSGFCRSSRSHRRAPSCLRTGSCTGALMFSNVSDQAPTFPPCGHAPGPRGSVRAPTWRRVVVTVPRHGCLRGFPCETVMRDVPLLARGTLRRALSPIRRSSLPVWTPWLPARAAAGAVRAGAVRVREDSIRAAMSSGSSAACSLRIFATSLMVTTPALARRRAEPRSRALRRRQRAFGRRPYRDARSI